MNKIYIGIDNGVTGTIGIIGDNIEPHTCKVPVKKEQNYTKAKDNITRLDAIRFQELLLQYIEMGEIMVVMERPMVNPMRFKPTTSALRCFEAELVIIESLQLPHMYIDSKEWQKVMLPKGAKGDDLKKSSLDIGNRLFPQFAKLKHDDRDGLLIAEYSRKVRL
jgi:hypothetical protein